MQIVRFLRVSGRPSPRGVALASLDGRAWENTLQWLDASGLTLAFWNRLKESEREGSVCPEIRARLDGNLASHRIRVAAMQREFDLINGCLEAAGIEYAALKGFALIPEYCRDPILRNSYDYDYLVRLDALEETKHALRNAGFALKKQYEHCVVYFRPALAARMPARRDELYSAAFGRTIELHTNLWDSDSLKIRLNVLEHALDRRILRRWESSHFYALGDEDHLLLEVLHTFWHILDNWCRLAWLLEIANCLEYRYADSAFWERFYKKIQSNQQLSEISGVVFALATGLFGGRSAPLVADLIGPDQSASLTLWVTQYGITSALDNFLINKFNLFLYREFVRDHATWREVRRTRLFPVHRPNRAVEVSSTRTLLRFIAVWKQGLHVARRLLHHLAAAIQYGWEAPKWERLRAEGRSTVGD